MDFMLSFLEFEILFKDTKKDAPKSTIFLNFIQTPRVLGLVLN